MALMDGPKNIIVDSVKTNDKKLVFYAFNGWSGIV
jgi:hypothetical protein